MGADRSIGFAIFIASILGFIVYAWLLLVSPWSTIVLQLTVLSAIAGLLGVLAWIGYTMAITPAPPSVEQQAQVIQEPEVSKKEQEMETVLSKEYIAEC